jgi:hypothetical protein
MYAPTLKFFCTKPPFIPAPKGTGFSGGGDIKQIGLGQPKFTPVENCNSDSSEAGNPIPLGVG